MREKILELLNELYALDPTAMERLVSTRTPCNGAVAKHEFVQVWESPGNPNDPRVGMLGILNGLSLKNGGGKIAAKWSKEDRSFLGFVPFPEESDEHQEG